MILVRAIYWETSSDILAGLSAHELHDRRQQYPGLDQLDTIHYVAHDQQLR